MSKHQYLIDYIKLKLSQSCEISINLDMSFYPGLYILRARYNHSMDINQSDYILSLEDRYNLKHVDCIL